MKVTWYGHSTNCLPSICVHRHKNMSPAERTQTIWVWLATKCYKTKNKTKQNHHCRPTCYRFNVGVERTHILQIRRLELTGANNPTVHPRKISNLDPHTFYKSVKFIKFQIYLKYYLQWLHRRMVELYTIFSPRTSAIAGEGKDNVPVGGGGGGERTNCLLAGNSTCSPTSSLTLHALIWRFFEHWHFQATIVHLETYGNHLEGKVGASRKMRFFISADVWSFLYKCAILEKPLLVHVE